MHYKLSILLIFVVFIAQGNGQNDLGGQTFIYSFNGGLCSTVWTLGADSVLKQNRGCEGPGTDMYLKYYRVDDTVFVHQGFDTLPPLRYQIEKKAVAKDTMEIRFFDQNGKNISREIRCKWQRSGNRFYTIKYDIAKDALISTEMVEADLIFTSLERALHKKVRLLQDDGTFYHINVQLDLRPEYVKYKILKHGYYKSNWVSKFLVKEHKLIEFFSGPYPPHMKKRVFKLWPK